ncbi:hypothetical protein HELRODRAFT_178556 [Helobdella robusta]|uniref:RING-type domain-containing protein n=1 Tax=Helobdella robusta TaxID=6412 RepID=T1FDD4_HELRO|nr:hypothetical protein HELRODRAFT_178556 [Helobdella robusta]ESN97105.1 hypothetical protein HELRODRAFT_178556 [Helobdella robusta]
MCRTGSFCSFECCTSSTNYMSKYIEKYVADEAKRPNAFIALSTLDSPLSPSGSPSSSPKPSSSSTFKVSKISVRKKKKHERPECPVCLKKIRKEPSYICKCFHLFCKSCVDKWIEINETCPMCRGPIQFVVYTERKRSRHALRKLFQQHSNCRTREVQAGVEYSADEIDYFLSILKDGCQLENVLPRDNFANAVKQIYKYVKRKIERIS